VPHPTDRAPGFRDVFAHREFRALWLSYVLSAAGDRLALVALTLLVYDRSRSPLLAAVTFAAGFVPYLAGGLLLSGLADRFPRRTVMIASDLARCTLVAAMLWPGAPLAVMIALMYAVTLLQPPFDAARSAVVRDMAGAGLYPLAAAALQSTTRVVAVAGAAAGGLVTAILGARPALAADAATFIASAVIIQAGIRARPAAAAAGPGPLAQLAGGARLVFGNPELRTLMCLGWLAAFYEVPEGIAVPYAGSLGGGAVAAGLLIAASQLGAAVATPAFATRTSPRARLRWMGPMAVLTCAVLLAAFLRPGLAPSMALFTVSNVFAVYQIAANTAFVERLPGEQRAMAFGLANAGLVVGQGAAFAVAGAVAAVVPPSAVVAASGALGTAAAFGLALSWRKMMPPAAGRHSTRRPARHAAPAGPGQAARARGEAAGTASLPQPGRSPAGALSALGLQGHGARGQRPARHPSGTSERKRLSIAGRIARARLVANHKPGARLPASPRCRARASADAVCRTVSASLSYSHTSAAVTARPPASDQRVIRACSTCATRGGSPAAACCGVLPVMLPPSRLRLRRPRTRPGPAAVPVPGAPGRLPGRERLREFPGGGRGDHRDADARGEHDPVACPLEQDRLVLPAAGMRQHGEHVRRVAALDVAAAGDHALQEAGDSGGVLVRVRHRSPSLPAPGKPGPGG
jgi:hypothetical protein